MCGEREMDDCFVGGIILDFFRGRYIASIIMITIMRPSEKGEGGRVRTTDPKARKGSSCIWK